MTRDAAVEALDPVKADDGAIDPPGGEGDPDRSFATSSGPGADRVNDAARGAWAIPVS